MKCPHCGHTDGFEIDDPDSRDERDSFYCHPVEMERSRRFDDDDRINLYGCPKCFKTFIYGY